MKKVPTIQVQLVHIDGPLKGEIQEFYKDVILVGRHPDCDVIFPKDDTMISRKHAALVREGNRYKLQDSSVNGTTVNGKPVKEGFLKTGDVLVFGEGGPKVSFLSAMQEPVDQPPTGDSTEFETIGVKVAIEPEPVLMRVEDRIVEPPLVRSKPEQSAVVNKIDDKRSDGAVETVQKSLVVQYGATLKAFRKLPVTIGNGADCDFSIPGRGLQERHLQIHFRNDRYLAKDLTGRNLITFNSMPVGEETVLTPDGKLALTPGGPSFQFLGDGRLAEISPDDRSEAAPVGRRRPGVPKGETGSGPADDRRFPRKVILVVALVFGCLAIAGAFVFYNSGTGGENGSGLGARFNQLVEALRSILQ